ncbi:hypothetical protein PISL3812_04320 [Talaromyces islandicus]|uniref:WW domain-containing protein n=1 Tax=Talaromyces islandicus TaxID=28573 RepID=A0A0U1LV77_TALIS|nr:hypothetical protein PISL3812_04320 [Talaromyces islandicus]
MSEDSVPSDAHIPPRSATPPSENPAKDDTKSEPHEEEEEGEYKEDAASHRDQIVESDHGEKEKDKKEEQDEAPPLPDEEVPPLPDEAPPGEAAAADDGWEPVWDANAQAYYFYNRLTGVSQWENPRVPEAVSASEPPPPGVDEPSPPPRAPAALGGYNPAIHGDYDPTAPYAQQYEQAQQAAGSSGGTEDPSQLYTATGAFNRFTGKWQDASLRPENYNDENKSRRQMHAFFDVDAAANSHNGRSLKAERSGKKLSKAEVKAFREKRRERKEEKRRAWLRD